MNPFNFFKSGETNDAAATKPASESERKAARPGNEAKAVSARRRWLERVALFASGAALAAAFPEANWSFLAWIGLIPLYWLTRDSTPGRAWRGGFLWGYGWSLCSFFWLREIEPFIPFLMALVLALFPAFWAMMVPILRRGLLIRVEAWERGSRIKMGDMERNPVAEVALAFALAAWWCVTEWIRSWIATGFPWNLLGVSQWRNIPVIQISEYTGVYGVSFLVALVGLSLALAVEGWIAAYEKGSGYRRPVPLIVALALLMIVVLIGVRATRAHRKNTQGDPFVVAVLQGDIPQCRAASDQKAMFALNEYLKLSELAVLAKPGLVIWPETAVPYPFRAAHPLSRKYRFEVYKLATTNKVPFLLGTIDFGAVPEDAADDVPPPVHNGALLIGKNGRIMDAYHKVHIVPFGEFTPFGDWLPWLRRHIGMGRDLTPGGRFNVISPAPGVKIGVNICFEDIFPYVAREQVLNGANLLLVLTNDAWYPTSSEPAQHLANSVFRAVENRRIMVRCGNNSGSVVVQPNGVISDSMFMRTDPRTGEMVPDPTRRGRGCANFLVRPPKNPPLTFHAKFPYAFILVCWIIFGAAALKSFAAWRERKRALLERFD